MLARSLCAGKLTTSIIELTSNLITESSTEIPRVEISDWVTDVDAEKQPRILCQLITAIV